MPKPSRPAEYARNIQFPAWRTHIKLCLTPDVDASIRWRDASYKDKDTEAMCMFSNSASTCLILHLDAPPAVIAHECWHSICKLLQNRGAELDNETVAYHLGYLVGEVHKFQKVAAARWPRRKS